MKPYTIKMEKQTAIAKMIGFLACCASALLVISIVYYLAVRIPNVIEMVKGW